MSAGTADLTSYAAFGEGMKQLVARADSNPRANAEIGMARHTNTQDLSGLETDLVNQVMAVEGTSDHVADDPLPSSGGSEGQVLGANQ